MGNTQSQQSHDEEQQDTQSCYGACFSRMMGPSMKGKEPMNTKPIHDEPDGDASKDGIPTVVGTNAEDVPDDKKSIEVTSHPEKVKVYGPGISEGRIGEKGVFTIETAEAGSGQMSVRVRGPKKSFDVRTQPHPTINDALLVEYNPTQTGTYAIDVEWTGVHVSGSPFTVNVVEGTEIIYHGTITPCKDFSPEKDAAVLQKSILDPGNGINEKAIIDILTSRSSEQRVAIKSCYLEKYQKDIAKELKAIFTGNMRRCTYAMLCSGDMYDATSLRKAMKSFKKKPDVVMEIICTRSSQDIHMVKEAYSKEFARDLEKDVGSEFSGSLKKFLLLLCQVTREAASEAVSEERVKDDVRKLSSSSEGVLDEDVVMEICTSRSYQHLRAVFDQYARTNQIDFMDAVDCGIRSNLKKGMKAFVSYIRTPHVYFAERLWETIKGGISLDDKSLIRILITRSEIDLVEVLKTFQQQYQKPLTKVIDEVTNGGYRHLLLTIISTK